MKVIDPNKLLSVALGTAGLYWATNKKLPDWLVITTLLATTVTLARDTSELLVEQNEIENNQLAGHCNCQNNQLTFKPFDIHL